MYNNSRRSFLKKTGYLSFGFLHLALNSQSILAKSFSKISNKKLKKDPKKILDIHPSLNYKIISAYGDKMDDGFKVPGLADGMGAFSYQNKTILIRNHELQFYDGWKLSPFNSPKKDIKMLKNNHYDPKYYGGTTSIIFDEKNSQIEKQYLSLSGTKQNCAGGVTPWNSWLTCEETINKRTSNNIDHGYVFEVKPSLEPSVQTPKPLKSLGRFCHEAVAFGLNGNLYLTEDRNDGMLYMFSPKEYQNLQKGKLFYLSTTNSNDQDTRNWNENKINLGEKFNIKWIPIDNPDPSKDILRLKGATLGASIFARTEGIVQNDNFIYFICTTGGPLKKGQIWRIDTSSNILELWYQVSNNDMLNMPDNIAVSPWGDLIICEDNGDVNRLWGMSKTGISYIIAENNYSGSEFAGACFSPVGNTLFVNLQSNGQTIAIQGNWSELSS